MLKIQFKDKRSDPIWVVERRYTIGSDSDNHLVLTDEGISPLHARLVTENGRLILRDNNSLAGCYVNGQRVTEKQIFPGDTLKLGSVELNILDASDQSRQASNDQGHSLWSLVADSSWLSGQEYPIPNNRVIVGRSSQCDIVIPGTHLSRQHAELTIEDSRLHIKDLASANGTFINDNRIEEAYARPGDRIRLDVYSFRLVGPEDDSSKTQLRRVAEPTVSTPRATSTEPKRWITKPTSPGNREEPSKSGQNRWAMGLSILLLIIMAALLIYIFI